MSEMVDRLVRRYEGGQMTRRELVVALSALMMARPAAGGAAPAAQPGPRRPFRSRR